MVILRGSRQCHPPVIDTPDHQVIIDGPSFEQSCNVRQTTVMLVALKIGYQ